MKSNQPTTKATERTRILGIDPGLSSTGWGMIECFRNDYKLIAKGAVKTTTKQDFPARLLTIYNAIHSVIETYTPAILAIEKTIYAKNIQIALTLGHVRGLLVLAAVQKNLAFAEYTPKEIKASITGNGNASKLQVQKMVQSLFAMKEMPTPHDIADALATAMCHFHRSRY